MEKYLKNDNINPLKDKILELNNHVPLSLHLLGTNSIQEINVSKIKSIESYNKNEIKILTPFYKPISKLI
jgi:hypothetical protein